jgi:uncharacterized membrane protein YqaE (UPF0057 family)
MKVMMKMKAVAYICLSLLFICSCALEKRVHQSGFHIVKKTNFGKSQNGATHSEYNESQDLAKAKKTTIKANKAITSSNKETAQPISEKLVAQAKEKMRPSKEANHYSLKEKTARKESASNLINTQHKKTETSSSTEDLSMDYLSEESQSKESSNNLLDDTMMILILILCFILPPVAVWLLTEDVGMLVISIILSILFWLPGIIFALYFFLQKY